VTNFWYLFAAYAAVWVGIFLYTRRLATKSRELEDEIRDLRSRLR
jgi:CcmD family protein